MDKKDFEKVYNDYLHQGEEHAQFEIAQEVTSGAEQIVAVRKNDEGDLIAFKTSSGRELNYMTALNGAKSGKLAHVDVFHKYGRDIIRSEPDGIKENNLDNLPSF
ncbi:DUF3892 domain-containing protein [Bacillus cereus]|nr:DUF3892 domain-containing protein [Bacillus cereus]